MRRRSFWGVIVIIEFFVLISQQAQASCPDDCDCSNSNTGIVCRSAQESPSPAAESGTSSTDVVGGTPLPAASPSGAGGSNLAASPSDKKQISDATQCSQGMQKDFQYLMQLNPLVGKAGITAQPTLQPCSAAISDLLPKLNACQSRASTAASGCIESLSPSLQKVTPILGLGLTAMSAMSSMQQVCQKQSELMDAANLALGAFNAECGAVKVMCDNSCKSATDALSNTIAACKTASAAYCTQTMAGYGPPDPDCIAGIAAAKQVSSYLPTVQTDDGNCVKSCGSYAMNLAAGAAGTVSSMLAMLQSKNCASAVTDCTQAANASSQYCVCQKNPTAANCTSAAGASGLADGGSTNPTNVSATPVAGSNAAGLGGLSPDGGLANPAAAPGQSLAGGGSGGGSSGGGGSLGGGVGSAASPGKPNALAATPNGGAGGGAGGGGNGAYGTPGSGWSDGAGGSGKGIAGKLDKNALGARAPASDVSGKAGKSNWDKVNNAYFQMSPNLMK